MNSIIQPNLAAIFICYLFYRGPIEATRTYWHLRNAIFCERTQALLTAVENLPPDRNPFGLTILPPTGSMYPLLQIGRLPAGLSLDWLASSLARRGVGLLPLATFARTEAGFETGRTTFRLTLGGVDGAETLLAKTRHLLIDLNRLIGEEEAHYNRKPCPSGSWQAGAAGRSNSLGHGMALPGKSCNPAEPAPSDAPDGAPASLGQPDSCNRNSCSAMDRAAGDLPDPPARTGFHQ